LAQLVLGLYLFILFFFVFFVFTFFFHSGPRISCSPRRLYYSADLSTGSRGELCLPPWLRQSQQRSHLILPRILRQWMRKRTVSRWITVSSLDSGTKQSGSMVVCHPSRPSMLSSPSCRDDLIQSLLSTWMTSHNYLPLPLPRCALSRTCRSISFRLCSA
jgi:hypothetical protein